MLKTLQKNIQLILPITLCLIVFFSVTINASAANYTVTNTNDSGAGSLRQALIDADATEEEDVINFAAETFSTPKTITLTTGEIRIIHSVTINGPGVNLLTISGNNQSRIFYSNYSNSLININNLTLTQGSAVNGGAIYSTNVRLILTNLIITGNKASGSEVSPGGFYGGLGGGIYTVVGSLTITNSIISDNVASGVVVRNTTNSNFGDYATSGGGGGVFSNASLTTIVNCVFTNNIAKGIDSPPAESRSGQMGGYAFGGAIYGTSNLNIINSSFVGNTATAGNGGSTNSTNRLVNSGKGGEAFGGAIFSSGSSILNSTFYNNSAIGGKGGTAALAYTTGDGGQSLGGAILDRNVKIANTTIVNNSVIAGAGRIGADGFGGGVYLGSHLWTVINSTITGNSVTGGSGSETNGKNEGGGVFGANDVGDVNHFHNNIVAENTAKTGVDVFGTFFNPANNLIRIGEETTGIKNNINGNIVGTVQAPIDPRLAPLAENGGLTKTRALLTGSPAINAGNNSSALDPFTSQPLRFDQRNFQRIEPAGGAVDIGAFELGASKVPVSEKPDLRSASDTGLNANDNITKSRSPVFDVLNVIPGAKVELLRNNVVVSDGGAVSSSIFLTDPNPPLDATVQYTSRQIIGGVTSEISSALSVTFDHTAPTVTINQSSQQVDPATNPSIRFDVVFSERVGGFERQDVSLAGSTADVSTAAIWINSTNYSTYSVEITGIRSPGLIIATLPYPAAAYDAALNYSELATSKDNSVNFQPNGIEVFVKGRIRKNSGLIRTPSIVTLTDNFTGEIWTARTNQLGYYNFTGLKIYQNIGTRFTVKIVNKSFVYTAPQPLSITGNRINLNYIVP